MEALYTPSLSTSKFSVAVSPFKPSPLSAYQISSILTSGHHSQYSLLLKCTSRISSGEASCIFAHFGRGSRRRNSLREKLNDEAQVRISKDFLHPKLDLNSQNNVPNQNVKFELKKNDGESEHNCFPDGGGGGGGGGSEVGTVGKSNSSGESLLWRKLEDWIDQYKQDAEYWGIGSCPIFTIYQDSNGNIERVAVDEDEIIKRSQIESCSLKLQQVEEHDVGGVNSKISRAKVVAREIKNGNYKIPENSSIAKFVIEEKKSFSVEGPGSITLKGDSISRVGIALLCGWFAFWVIKNFFLVRNDKRQLTSEEKEMLRRKMKVRMETERESSSLEILGDNHDISVGAARRPQLDKHELLQSILQAKLSKEPFALSDHSSNISQNSTDYSQKILEIQEMARKARDFKCLESAQLEKDEPDIDSSATQWSVSGEKHNNNSALSTSHLDCEKFLSNGSDNSSSHVTSRTLDMEGELEKKKDVDNPSDSGNVIFNINDIRRESGSHDPLYDNSSTSQESSVSTKPKIIKSVREAREYLSKRQELYVGNGISDHVLANSTDSNGQPNQVISWGYKKNELPHIINASSPASEDSMHGKEDSHDLPRSSEQPETSPDDESVCTNGFEKNYDACDLSMHVECSSEVSTDTSSFQSDKPHKTSQSWIEENFEELEPIIKKIGDGFRENYLAAKDNVQEDPSLTFDLNLLKEDLDALEWMKDESLRDIVFRVRENELAGRDPFHMMDAEDKCAFFMGLEKVAERKNSKLVSVHKWIHSKVENLDYGADGISLDDPPEKFVARWKGPPVDEDPQFLKNLQGQQKLFSQNLEHSHAPDQRVVNEHKVASEQPSSYGSQKLRHVSPPKTVIESSSGSTRAGNKKGKEHWEHTKKWTQGFLEVYNAESDPEVKSTMKEFGKDLDRWITEKEIQEAADLMTHIPKRRRKYIEKKLDKLKREMEMFGPQAVVSKYREYSEAKEEDYLWWLDLSFILDVFRQAKANGFNVTVIRKGEIELNVDETLEEVEDDIMEIGSKMYHDEIMRERSVDMGTLMKGVFGVRKSIRR
ncbi:uncharacterized protein [Aristolochia californica]|uniref:uncharacterized protein isoform X2 n=1 Tax=Aristolochia californica TaxID=171875 RepID=UPI0035D60F10